MKVAVCLIVRDEARYLPEWMAYHVALGFDTIIIFDNKSADATTDIISEASNIWDVRVIYWPFTHSWRQIDAYLATCREFSNEFDWIAFIDADEFILPLESSNVKEWLSTIGPDASAIGVHWAMYGSSGHMTPPSGMVIENYVNRAPDKFGPNAHVKCLVRPKQVIGVTNPHFFVLNGKYVDPSGGALTFGMPGVTDRFGDITKCRINHYFTRSRDDWERRMLRGRFVAGSAKRTWEEFEKYDRNEVFDQSISRFAGQTRDHMLTLFSKIPMR